MLYLGRQDLLAAATRDEIMDAIEKAYALVRSNNYQMPPRMHVESGHNTLLYMPCFTDKIIGTKILSLFPQNAAKNRPVIEGVVVLNDPECGAPLAILDGAMLTALRTGAVGGVAVRHLTDQNLKKVGLIGAGVQGYQQLLFALTARNLEAITVYDQDRNKVSGLLDKLQSEYPTIKLTSAQSPEQLLASSELVITATPATVPVLPDDPGLLAGKTYIAIGSYKPEMRELPKGLYPLLTQVLVDTDHALHESGDLITPIESKWINSDQVLPFADILVSRQDRQVEGTTKLFKSVGMALFDIQVAEMIYQQALAKNIGQQLA